MVSVVDLVLDFLFTAVQIILFVEGVYPSDLFERNRKFGAAVSICRHPDVTSYLRDVLSELKQWLAESKVEKLIVPIIDQPSSSTIRRYVFSIAEISSHLNDLDEKALKGAEVLFHGALSRLMNQNQRSQKPDQVTWDIVAATSGVELGDHWTSADGPEKRELPSDSLRIVPVKHVEDSSLVRVEVYIEESTNAVVAKDKD